MDIDHSQSYIFTMENVLSKQECSDLIEKINDSNPKVAPINTASGTHVRTNIRNNERIIFDDCDLAKDLLKRVNDKIPQQIHNMQLCGVNEKFRCYRYKKGMRFAPHADGSFVRSDNERSCYTFLIYLNEGFKGGETIFYVEPEIAIQPQTGMALFFQHPIFHEGALVTSGVKYVLRSDLMYSK